jgi:hypothetical protein
MGTPGAAAGVPFVVEWSILESAGAWHTYARPRIPCLPLMTQGRASKDSQRLGWLLPNVMPGCTARFS